MKALAIISVLSALGACVDDTYQTDDELERKKPKPTQPPPQPTPTAGAVACYSQTYPSATCNSPSHCCFDSTINHNGSCMTSSCSWSTITCDGPEDCASGQKCCATIQPNGQTFIGCATSCLPPAHNALAGEELCHEPSICSGGRWCITAFPTNPALPGSLSICR